VRGVSELETSDALCTTGALDLSIVESYAASLPLPSRRWPWSLGRTLTAVDRCDRCGARAYVRVLLPSRLDLLFCAHHNRQYASELTKIAVEIRDETERLTRTPA
jgi:hypothetical protein